MKTKPLIDAPWPPSDAKPGDTHGTLTLCHDGVWRDRLHMPDHLINQVWNHMHGVNMDGKGRHGHRVQREKECAENWQALSDAIGEYLSEGEE